MRRVPNAWWEAQTTFQFVWQQMSPEGRLHDWSPSSFSVEAEQWLCRLNRIAIPCLNTPQIAFLFPPHMIFPEQKPLVTWSRSRAMKAHCASIARGLGLLPRDTGYTPAGGLGSFSPISLCTYISAHNILSPEGPPWLLISGNHPLCPHAPLSTVGPATQ